MASISRRENGRWRARYRDHAGQEHNRSFLRKVDAQQWLDQETAKLVTGSWVAPRTAKMTMKAWTSRWLEGYATRKPQTVRQAEVHVAKIDEHFGGRRLDSIRPSDIKNWLAKLKAEGLADSYVYALHGRLSQILTDAVHDGVLARSPASRRTSPRAGQQRPYVATTDQVWALHDAIGERYRAGVLLAAFSGLRLAEVCGLRLADVDFMRGVVSPAQQYPSEPLKTEMSKTPIPIPESLALTLSAHVAEYAADGWMLTDEWGHQLGPWQLQRAFRSARALVLAEPKKRLPRGAEPLLAGFRFHDLRHYYASLLIASGLDVKVVQARLRHGSAKTTLDTYGHLWPDSDDSTRAAINSVIAARSEAPAANLRPGRGSEALSP